MPVTNTTSRILALAAVALAGCATGHDGDVNIGSGQSPDPVVLDAHQCCLAQLAGPPSECGQDDDRLPSQAPGLGAIARLEPLGLPAGPRARARFVLALERHQAVIGLGSWAAGIGIVDDSTQWAARSLERGADRLR